ncbi:hypothetical protein Hdeb2414_s0005g00179671 [Helianthus debilis subsp. tardiflorus]
MLIIFRQVESTSEGYTVSYAVNIGEISVICRLYRSYRSLSKISVSNIGTDIIGDIDRYIIDIFDRYITDISLNYWC